MPSTKTSAASAPVVIVTFDSPDDFFAALLGPVQHDAHLARWRLAQWGAVSRARSEAVEQEVQKIIAEIRARKAGLANSIRRAA